MFLEGLRFQVRFQVRFQAIVLLSYCSELLQGQPIDPPGMSQQVAEGLATLNERVEELRTQLQDVRGECSQFDLILEQYNKAPQSEAGEHTRKALLKTGEAMVEVRLMSQLMNDD